MIAVGDRVRLLRDYTIPTDCGDDIYANKGNEGVVVEVGDEAYDVYFHDGWGGTMTIYHHEEDYCNLEKVESA